MILGSSFAPKTEGENAAAHIMRFFKFVIKNFVRLTKIVLIVTDKDNIKINYEIIKRLLRLSASPHYLSSLFFFAVEREYFVDIGGVLRVDNARGHHSENFQLFVAKREHFHHANCLGTRIVTTEAGYFQ